MRMRQRPQTQKSDRRRNLDVAAFLVLAGFAILVASGRGPWFDRAVAEWLQSLAAGRPWLDTLMFGVTHFGDTLSLIFATILFATLLAIRSRERREPLTLILTYSIAWAANNLLKLIFARPRPQLSSLFVDPTGYSFPSGHAMISSAVYGCITLLLSEAFPQHKWLFRICAIILVIFIGMSRVYLDAHWPSDVVAGFAGGWITISIVRAWLPPSPQPTPR